MIQNHIDTSMQVQENWHEYITLVKKPPSNTQIIRNMTIPYVPNSSLGQVKQSWKLQLAPVDIKQKA